MDFKLCRNADSVTEQWADSIRFSVHYETRDREKDSVSLSNKIVTKISP